MTYDYSAVTPDPMLDKGDLLQTISQTAKRQFDAQKLVADKEIELANAQSALKIIVEVELPALMEKAGMTSFTTSEGLEVEVGDVIRASIPKDRSPETFAWLRANKHDGIIKHSFTVDFGKDEAERSSKFADELSEKGYRFDEKRAVHPATLVSFVKEQLTAGTPFPMELFGVFRQKVSKIKVKK